MIASWSDSRAKSVVAEKPFARAPSIYVGRMRRMYDRPASSSSTFLESMSKPVTLNPASDKSRESGNPTYPSPMTPIRALRASRRARRSRAIRGKATWPAFGLLVFALLDFGLLEFGWPGFDMLPIIAFSPLVFCDFQQAVSKIGTRTKWPP